MTYTYCRIIILQDHVIAYSSPYRSSKMSCTLPPFPVKITLTGIL